MIVLLPGNVKAFKDCVKNNPTQWGWLITPRRSMAKTLSGIPGARWAADNECFTLGDSFDPSRYLRFLERLRPLAHSCLFVTAPDMVADAKATLVKLPEWSDKIRKLDLPVALVAQDGLEDLIIPWNDFDALFIGGTTVWKLSPVVKILIGEAKARGKWGHIGRVNSQRRLRYAIGVGADSVDGTEWAINPGRGIRWANQVIQTLKFQRQLL